MGASFSPPLRRVATLTACRNARSCSFCKTSSRTPPYCSTTGPPMCQGAAAETPAAPGDAAPVGGSRRQRRWWPTGRRRGGRDDGAVPLPGSVHRRSVPDPPHHGTRAPRGARLARPRGRGGRRLTRRHAAGAARCAWDGYFPSSEMIASGDLTCMEGIICIGW